MTAGTCGSNFKIHQNQSKCTNSGLRLIGFSHCSADTFLPNSLDFKIVVYRAEWCQQDHPCLKLHHEPAEIHSMYDKVKVYPHFYSQIGITPTLDTSHIHYINFINMLLFTLYNLKKKLNLCVLFQCSFLITGRFGCLCCQILLSVANKNDCRGSFFFL